MNHNELGTYLYNEDIQDLFLNASIKLYNAVAHTIGPNGSNTAIPTSNGFLSIINDGKTILETISSADIAEKFAVNTLKESSYATNKEAGDGTSTTVVLQHNLLLNSVSYNKANSITKIKPRLLEEVRDYLLEKLKSYKKDIESDDDLKKVITVALGSDKFTDVVFESFKGLSSRNQKPTLVKVNDKVETGCTVIDGLNLSPVEINPVVIKSINASQDEPLDIIILNQEVSRIDNAFAALLQKISKSTKKTILFYTDIKGGVMDQLLFNIQEGALNLIPVRLAMPIFDIPTVVSDLEDYFGCKAFTDLFPYQTNYNDSNIIGSGIGYIMNKDSIIVKNDNENYNDPNSQPHLLQPKSSVIEVGFITFSQQAEDYRRLEDAIQSAYNALNYGYVLGAGYTYFCLGEELSDDELYKPIKEALQEIFMILKPENLTQIEFIKQIEDNVFDSYKVAEQVILNSFTVVSQILSTNCFLVPYQRNRITGALE